MYKTCVCKNLIPIRQLDVTVIIWNSIRKWSLPTIRIKLVVRYKNKSFRNVFVVRRSLGNV
jgi:hypothetical protein